MKSQNYKSLVYSSLVFGTIGIILFLYQKNTEQIPIIYKHLGKIFIGIAIYLLAISILQIPTTEEKYNYDDEED